MSYFTFLNVYISISFKGETNKSNEEIANEKEETEREEGETEREEGETEREEGEIREDEEEKVMRNNMCCKLLKLLRSQMYCTYTCCGF